MKSGIPTISDYQEAISTPAFKSMEKFSAEFLSANKKILGKYRRRWVADPIHQWSRQWEYPFVFEKLAEKVTGLKSGARVLDAGAGATFFPHLLSAEKGLEVFCVDNDPIITEAFAGFEKTAYSKVRFKQGSLTALPYDANYFDAVYCISVLEHMPEPRQVIEEFRKVLKPGGLLVVTFDISLDGKSEILPEKAQIMLDDLKKAFTVEGQMPGNIQTAIAAPQIFTSKHSQLFNKKLQPLKLRIFPRDLTCFCAVFVK